VERCHRYLGIYVRDHHAACAAGIALARRTGRENRGTPLGATLTELIPHFERDRRILQEVVSALGMRTSAAKDAGARLGEVLGHLKLNGKARGYSPVSRLLELEVLLAAIDAKRSLWRSLAAARRLELEPFDFDDLVLAAAWQRDQLAPHHERAASEAFDDLWAARLHEVVPV
jgi:hypothetical protein